MRRALAASLLAACLLASALVACGDRPDTERRRDMPSTAKRDQPALRVLGIAHPVSWPERQCGIDVPKAIAPDTQRAYRRCDLPDSTGGATLVLDWTRKRVVSGSRSFFHPDSARWQRFRDSVVAALDSAGTPLRCAKAESELGDTLELAKHMRLWALREERRWVMVSELSDQERFAAREWIGALHVRTDPGEVEPCDILLWRRIRRDFVM